VPISHARDAASVAEERRLLHVALSRAARELHLTWAAQRTFSGRPARRKPSAYLDLVLAACRPGPHDRVADPNAGLAQARAVARSVQADDAPYDRELFSALREWRRAEALAHGLPAFTIFHDATLRAIAASVPTTSSELLAVPGIGPTKLDRYGERVLELVADHAARAVTAGPTAPG
jgi:DNA helicase-2/ATP-dependent DNA helicase PcrA